MEPFEHSTSSENDTLEFLDCLLDEEVEEELELEETLSGRMGTTTGAS